MSKSFHLSGIVPVAGFESDFNFPWHDCMQPIAPNYLAIEHAVIECAYAGCNTIWIVCNDDMQPLIRHRLGDFVQDPIWINRSHEKFPKEHRKQIPIFYIPIHPKDYGKRDCYAWSILYGAVTAWRLSKVISKWIVPRKYYVSFPYGIYCPKVIREHRTTISSEKNFYLSYNGKTFQDGEYLGFSFGEEEYKQFRDIIRTGTGELVPGTFDFDKTKRQYLPFEERYSARHFTLDKVFKDGIMSTAVGVELSWYYPIDNWENLTTFLGSEERKIIKRPHKAILSYKELNPMGVDNEE
tara:strand:+ start:1585 stop:2472 length:888 start_codon:yes stop_codon:yes gene_type:complete